MPAVIIRESCRDIGLEVGLSPEVLFVVTTDSQATLTHLRNESVTTRSRLGDCLYGLLAHDVALFHGAFACFKRVCLASRVLLESPQCC